MGKFNLLCKRWFTPLRSNKNPFAIGVPPGEGYSREWQAMNAQ